MEVWLPVLCFFLGLFTSYIIYRLLCLGYDETDKLIVFKSKRLSKKERIEKLESFTKDLDYQIRYIKNRIIDLNFNFYPKEKKNK